jgi:hypothetical protein
MNLESAGDPAGSEAGFGKSSGDVHPVYQSGKIAQGNLFISAAVDITILFATQRYPGDIHFIDQSTYVRERQHTVG